MPRPPRLYGVPPQRLSTPTAATRETKKNEIKCQGHLDALGDNFLSINLASKRVSSPLRSRHQKLIMAKVGALPLHSKPALPSPVQTNSTMSGSSTFPPHVLAASLQLRGGRSGGKPVQGGFLISNRHYMQLESIMGKNMLSIFTEFKSHMCRSRCSSWSCINSTV